MNTSFTSTLIGIIMLILLGAGCGTSPKNSSVTTSEARSSRVTQATTSRVEVPDLGFSYIPYTTDTRIYDGAMTSGTRVLFGNTDVNFRNFDFIERIPQMSGQSIDETLHAFMKSTGGSPTRCSLISSTSTENRYAWLPGGWQTITFVPKTVIQPTVKEIYTYLRSNQYPKAPDAELQKICESSPECEFAKNDLIQQKNTEQCGLYSITPQYQVVSMFIMDPANTSTMLYVHTTGWGSRSPFDGGPLHISPSKQ